jgi:uncharacterized Zn finger protein
VKRTTEERADTAVHLDCEVCAEKSVTLIPRQRAPYAIVDCPRCGTTYLVSLDSREEASRPQSATGGQVIA